LAIAKITGAAPILLVADVKASAAFYREKLGFQLDQLYDDPINFAILSRDGNRIFLSQAADKSQIVPHHAIVHNMWNVYFWTDDALSLSREFQGKGIELDYGIEEKAYGVKEFGIQDPDGYDIGFAEIIKP
jgi:catechol 2,3-dioxygenase-like lactoylglutathione lyase family enzyme